MDILFGRIQVKFSLAIKRLDLSEPPENILPLSLREDPLMTKHEGMSAASTEVIRNQPLITRRNTSDVTTREEVDDLFRR
jgi:hypothetical protein